MARTRKDAPAAVKDAPRLDLTTLATSVREEKMTPGGARFAHNPFIDLLRDSYRLDQAGQNGVRAVDVLGVQVREITAALRNAVMRLSAEEIGIKIRYVYRKDGVLTETGNERDVPEDDQNVTVKFVGTKKKFYLKKVEREEAVENGFVIDGDPKRIDVPAYLAWREEQDEDEDSDEYVDEDENGDQE